MQEELIFSKIVNNTIFVDDYTKFEKNNVVTFSNSGIVVLYGPNGTGKTSLVKVLSGEKEQKYHIITMEVIIQIIHNFL